MMSDPEPLLVTENVSSSVTGLTEATKDGAPRVFDLTR